MHGRSLIALLGAFALASLTAYSQQELSQWRASDPEYLDRFGEGVALAGDRALVGMISGPFNPTPGHVYLFDVSGGQLDRWEAADAAAYDRFGWDVGMSGEDAIIGAAGATGVSVGTGAAYVFDISTGQEVFKLFAPDGLAGQLFGVSVAVNGDLAIVGAPYSANAATQLGAAYLFDVTTGQQLFKLTASDGELDDFFGGSVAISGDRCIVGSRHDDDQGNNSGAAYIYDVTTGQELFKLTGSQSASSSVFGQSVAISGNRAVVGASYDEGYGQGVGLGRAYIFDVATGLELFDLIGADTTGVDRFGFSVAMSGERLAVGAFAASAPATGAGAAYIFDVTTGAELYKLTPSATESIHDQFGTSVAMNGDRTLIGAANEAGVFAATGAAYLFAGAPPGSSYCTAAPNSTGLGSMIHTSGSPSLADESLSLHATNAPAGQPCLFYVGTIPLSTPFGDGFRCVGGSALRLNPPVMESASTYTKTIDFSAHGPALTSMGTAYFQCWYRDPAAGGAGFNLSDGLELPFVP